MSRSISTDVGLGAARMSRSPLVENRLHASNPKVFPMRIRFWIPTVVAVIAFVVGGTQIAAQQNPPAGTPAKTEGTAGQTKAPLDGIALDEEQLRVFTLQNSSAVECIKILKELYADMQITADPRTNSLLVKSQDESRLKMIEAILLKLDEAPANPFAAAVAANPNPNLPAADTAPVLVVFRLKYIDPAATEAALQKLFQGRLEKIAVDVRTNSLVILAKPDVIDEAKKVLQVLDADPVQRSHKEGNRLKSAPASPAPNQLIEQLRDQESTALAEAERIRLLKAEGRAEQDQQKIAEYQRKLTSLLGTSFDLKLQLEELQVKDLQSRLSRLERQIAQRKELREKIIARRAAELIEGDELKWNSSADAERNPMSSTTGATHVDRSASLQLPASDETIETLQPVPENISDDERVWRTLGLRLGSAPPLRAKENRGRFTGGMVVLEVRPDSPAATAQMQKGDILCGLHVWQTESLSHVMFVLNHPDRLKFEPLKFFVIRKGEPLAGHLDKIAHDGGKAINRGMSAPQSSGGKPDSMGGAAASPGISIWEAKFAALPVLDVIQQGRQRVATARKSVRELEAAYFRDNSGVLELKAALDELQKARADLATPAQFIGATVLELRSAAVSTRERLDEMKKSPYDTASINELTREMATLDKLCQKSEKYFAAVSSLGLDDLESQSASPSHFEPSAAAPKFPPGFALGLLESCLGLKLELVRCEHLGLPFKAALRVREAAGEHQAGDLIVVLNDRRFMSLDEALQALRSNAWNAGQSRANSLAMRGGLAGTFQPISLNVRWDEDFTQSGEASKAITSFEVRVGGAENAELQTKYFSGVFVSPNGLAVIPVASKALAPGETIVVYGQFKGTAQVVASDDTHGLTLVKVEVPKRTLFTWLKCRTAMPTKGQTLNDSQRNYEAAVLEVGQPLPAPLTGTDAFVVSKNRSSDLSIGAPFLSVDGDVQGIAIAWSDSAPAEKPGDSNNVRLLGIPAVYIDRLLNGYYQSSDPTDVKKPLGIPVTPSAEIKSVTPAF